MERLSADNTEKTTDKRPDVPAIIAHGLISGEWKIEPSILDGLDDHPNPSSICITDEEFGQRFGNDQSTPQWQTVD